MEEWQIPAICQKTGLDKYIRTGVMEDSKKRRRIDSLHEKNLFKVKPMPGFEI